MFKPILLAGTLLLLFTAGCNNSQKGDSSASSKDQSSQISKSSQKSQKKANTKSSSKTSQSESSKASSSSQKVNKNQLSNLNVALKKALPSALLPNVVPTTRATINAGFSGNDTNYAIYYSPADTDAALNAGAVTSANADYALRKQHFTSQATAQAQINYQTADPHLQQVQLGDGQVGSKQGAAGSVYLTWNEGNWSITVRADNTEDHDPEELAKQAVALFAKQALPAPDGHAAVELFVEGSSARQNQITWRKGSSLYTVSGQDAMSLLELATSLH